MTGRRGRRRRKLLDDLKKRRGYSHLKEGALDRTMWRARFGRGFGPVVRQTTSMNDAFMAWTRTTFLYLNFGTAENRMKRNTQKTLTYIFCASKKYI